MTSQGTLLRPGDPDYEQARKVWNGMIDRRPALIARCAGAADVIRAVELARERGLLLAVRGGGHNVAGNAVCDGGLVIDLSGMNAIRVDPARRTARAEGGVYVNYLGAEAEEGAERVRAAYGAAKYERLAALKAAYDPGNLFRMNQNISPAP